MQIVSVVKDSFIESAPFNWGISLFSFGCNLKCSFCMGYNYETVTNKNNIIGDVITVMENEVKPCHDCVIFIGGEPTIWGDKLIEALRWCKEHSKKTKIFTNGFDYKMVEKINGLKLCDAWSIDYKGLREKVGSYVGVNGEEYYDNSMKSILNVVGHNLPLEIRTTYFSDNLCDKEEIRAKIKEIEAVMQEEGFSNYFKYFEQDDFRKNL